MKIKKNVMIASIAGVTALTTIAALATSPAAQAANETASTSATKSTQKDAGKGAKFMGGEFGPRGHGNDDGGMFGGGRGGQGFGMMHMDENSDLAKAVIAGDYNAYVTAFNADTNKPENATVMTEEQFKQMVAQYQKQQARQTAIDNNDYDAYVAATTPSKEEFAQIVSRNTQEKAIKTAIENKDYNAYIAVLNADTNRPTDAKTPTEEEFNNMITNMENREANRDIKGKGFNRQAKTEIETKTNQTTTQTQ